MKTTKFDLFLLGLVYDDGSIIHSTKLEVQFYSVMLSVKILNNFPGDRRKVSHKSIYNVNTKRRTMLND